MKHSFLLLIFLLVIPLQILAFNDIECGMENENQEYLIDPAQKGGMLITADGILKVLIVCVRFPDDNDNSIGDWPVEPVG